MIKKLMLGSFAVSLILFLVCAVTVPFVARPVIGGIVNKIGSFYSSGSESFDTTNIKKIVLDVDIFTYGDVYENIGTYTTIQYNGFFNKNLEYKTQISGDTLYIYQTSTTKNTSSLYQFINEPINLDISVPKGVEVSISGFGYLSSYNSSNNYYNDDYYDYYHDDDDYFKNQNFYTNTYSCNKKVIVPSMKF